MGGALTLLQPFAHLIVSTPEDLAALATTPFGKSLASCGISLTPKRIENRPRPLSYEGELFIHAGAGESWLAGYSRGEDHVRNLAFGAIVGVVTLRGCFRLVENRDVAGDYMPPPWAWRQWRWLRGHPHVIGPCCLVLDNVRRFRQPVPWRGKQGFWSPERWQSTPQRLAELQRAIESAEPVEWTP